MQQHGRLRLGAPGKRRWHIQSSTVSPVGSTPGSVTAADFNGDGIPDLAVPNIGSNSVSILLGNGDGTFTAQPAINLGNNSPDYVGVGDLDGNGTQDLVIANRYTSGATGTTATVMLNQITATATAALTSVSLSGSGIHQILASYPGDTNYQPSTSGTVSLLAGQIATTLTLSASRTSSAAGSQITLTATLSPYNLETLTTDGETVTFYNGSANIGTGTLSSGVATLNVASLPAGITNTLTAVYPGDTNFKAATSNSVPYLVEATTLSLSASPNPSVFGNQVTLTATLSPYSAGSLTTNGETVTFYYDSLSIGTGTLSSGVATLKISSLPIGINTLTASYARDANFLGANSNSFLQTVITTSGTIPSYVVTTAKDATTGVASNCTATKPTDCSLRDALTAAAAAGAGNITFDPTVFAAPQTITLANGSLTIPASTTITGPTTGKGTNLTNLVTVSGGGPVFTVNTQNAVISDLTITGGGGIVNSGVLTVSDSTISGNSGSYSYPIASGGGIENYGTLTLINSTVVGNSVTAYSTNQGSIGAGGGIDNQGTLTITNSSVVGNSVSGYAYGGPSTVTVVGGGISNYGTLTMTNSVVAGNSATGTALPGSDPATTQVPGAAALTAASPAPTTSSPAIAQAIRNIARKTIATEAAQPADRMEISSARVSSWPRSVATAARLRPSLRCPAALQSAQGWLPTSPRE